MEIDARNFLKNLNLIKKSIESADFISFDCEFTGIKMKLKNCRNSHQLKPL